MATKIQHTCDMCRKSIMIDAEIEQHGPGWALMRVDIPTDKRWHTITNMNGTESFLLCSDACTINMMDRISMAAEVKG